MRATPPGEDVGGTGRPAGLTGREPVGTPLRDAVVVFALAFSITFALGRLATGVPLVAENLVGLVGLAFLYLPLRALAWRRESPVDYGVTTRGGVVGLKVATLTTLALIVPFTLGYHLFHGVFLGRPPSFAADRLRRFSEPLEGRPVNAEQGARLHLFVEGDRLVALAGRDYPGSPVELELDSAPCRLEAGERCATIVQRGGALRVRAAREAPTLHLGRHEVRAMPPIEARHGFAWWWTFVLIQLGLVALPEEVLYRGYLQPKLDQRFAQRWWVLGAQVGPGLFITAALFAVGHMAIEPGPYRLAVFFPALLFGWLRARTGSILAPVIVHAAANLLIRAVSSFYYP